MKNVSTNILRDAEREIDFIATPNSKEVFERIFVDKGTKSFNLIGNYGTGKSTFLWACEQVLLKKTNLFGIDNFKQLNGDFKIIKILGEEESLLTLFARSMGLPGRINTKRLIEQLNKALEGQKQLVIFIDEFGKALEYIAKNKASSELYFLQQLAEWVNGHENSVYLITTLHQNFATYSQEADKSKRQEWEKVKGRYRDIVFNEPVEQLLFFASKGLENYTCPDDSLNQINGILKLVNESKLVSFNKILSKEVVESLYPLDWLSANILVQSLQKYGQNERSLFTFVNETSKVSISKNKDKAYSVSKVYDYLVSSLPSEINNPNNSHRAQWLTAFRALERAELFFEEDYDIACRLIKTILLVNLFSKTGGKLDAAFLINYFDLTEGKNVEKVISQLTKAGIIRFYNHSNKLNFLEGTDIDIEQELIDAGKEISATTNYVKHLKGFVQLDVIHAKRHSFEKGTKRFFEFRIIESLDDVINEQQGVDGFINIIAFEEKESNILEKTKRYINNGFVLIVNTLTIELNVDKIIKYDLLIEKHSDDINALKLLTQERNHAFEVLKLELSKNLYLPGNKWFFDGQNQKIESTRDLHVVISKLCDNIFFKTPTFDNELVNRTVLSPPILSARRFLFGKLLENSAELDLGYPKEKFPPDKAIYISMLRETGIHNYDSEQNFYHLAEPKKGSVFRELWDDCNKFLDSSVASKKNISELYQILNNPPYRLKKGFVDFFIPVYLITKKEDYALFYEDNTYVPFLSQETLDLFNRKPEKFFVKAYNVKGLNINLLESYKELVGISGDRPTKSTFLSIYSNFLRFIRGLDKYTLKTNKISPAANELRNAIINTTDPETALFSSIPVALGYGNILNEKNEEKLKSFTIDIQNAIKELRTAYSELLNRIESYLSKAFDLKSDQFIEYKQELINKLGSIDDDELIPVQKVLFKRITSALDDRDSYLKSIADAVIGYPVEELKDHDETILKDRLLEYAKALIIASDAQSFNKNNPGSKLLQFKFYNTDGSIEDEKIILSSTVNNEEYIENIDKVLNGFDIPKKKEILIQLYSKLKKIENE